MGYYRLSAVPESSGLSLGEGKNCPSVECGLKHRSQVQRSQHPSDGFRETSNIRKNSCSFPLSVIGGSVVRCGELPVDLA